MGRKLGTWRDLGADLVAMACTCSVAVWLCFALLTASRSPSPGTSEAACMLISLATVGMAVGAGVMSAVRGRLLAERAFSLVGLGLVIYGLVLVGVDDLVLPFAGHWSHRVGLVRDLAWILIMTLVVSDLSAGDSGTRFWKRRLFGVVPLCAAGLVVTAAVDAGTISGHHPLWSANWVVADSVAAAAWEIPGFLVLWKGFSGRNSLLIWCGVAMCTFGEGRVALMLAADNGLWHMAGELLRAVGMLAVLLGSTRAAGRAIYDHRVHLRDSLRAVEGEAQSRMAERQRQEEMVHDLLSAITAVGSAARMLVVDDLPLADTDREGLASAIEAELRRVRDLVRRCSGRHATFRLGDALLPVGVCARAAGAEISMDIPPLLEADGDAGATAEIVRTLIDNAVQHAPGSPIQITAILVEETVMIMVADRGPGLPEGAEDLVFERGWTTGESDRNSGLGLFVAARLARQQDGWITAASRPGGGARFTLALPAAEVQMAVDLREGPLTRPHRTPEFA